MERERTSDPGTAEVHADEGEIRALRREIAILESLSFATVDPSATLRNRVILFLVCFTMAGPIVGLVLFALVELAITRIGAQQRDQLRALAREARMAGRGRWPFERD